MDVYVTAGGDLGIQRLMVLMAVREFVMMDRARSRVYIYIAHLTPHIYDDASGRTQADNPSVMSITNLGVDYSHRAMIHSSSAGRTDIL